MKVNIFLIVTIALFVVLWFSQNIITEDGETIYVAFAGPMEKGAGKTMTNAIKLYIEQANEKKILPNNKKLKLLEFDDKNDCKTDGTAHNEARRIVEENKALAVIGHWYSGCSITGGQVYKKYGIPAITPGSVSVKVTQDNEWYFRNIYKGSASGQFLANYVKQVFKLNQVTIIDDSSGYGSYLAEMFKNAGDELGMKAINYKFKEDDNKEQEIKKIVQQIKQNQKQAGAILVAVQATDAVKIVKQIKDENIPNAILGGSSFSEQAFKDGFDKFPQERINPGHYTNDIYVATPLIFDTANQTAQKFQEQYKAKYPSTEEMDWSAAYAYDTMMVLVKAIIEAEVDGNQEKLKEDRAKLRDALASFNDINQAIEGTTGFNYFDDNRDAQKPVAIGVYKNKNIVSALTQFQVIRNLNEISDIEEAKKNERVLMIGNKHMYKTNVVYTGIKINEISEPDFKNLTVMLDFHLWFRSQGKFKPQQIEFLNAINPKELEIQLENPIEGPKTKDQITYSVYKIRGKFKADFLESNFAYKQHIIGVSFHHKKLTRNNLIYVTDVLGMGKANTVLKKLQDDQVLSPASGWSAEQVRFFQDVAKKFSLGDPEYLNVQGGTIDYSRFSATILIKKNEFTLRGKLPYNYAQNIIVLSGIFILLLNLATKKFRSLSKLIWFFQTVLAFLLLLSGEVVFVNMENIETYKMEFIIRVFDILWWLTPAFMVNLASESFIWTPLEERSGRLIPNVVRIFLAFLIYFFSVVGIVAFVYDQQLTSILATSGVIAMIIGLAIQINISNIFSGIAINIERPFRIGDWVKIGEYDEGEIIDITWRTTRIKTRAECILSIPNSMASESAILNFCFPDDVYWLWPTVYVHPMHPPTRVRKILLDALLSADKVLKEPAPVVLFTGINEWAASYWIAFCADDYADKNFILEDVWTRVWFHLNRAGITPAVQRQEIYMFKGIKERGGKEATKPITLLQEVDIFKHFSMEAKTFLSESIKRYHFSQGDVIVKQGDEGDSLFIVVEGVVGVQVQTDDGRTKEVARLGAGDFFGEMALLTGESRTATVIALVDTDVFELTKADIKPLIAEQPEVSKMVSRVLTQRQMLTRSQMHVQHNVETEREAVYKRFLNKIENFFGLKEEEN
ncbi:ABC transporter substrate-binding protein [Candidatus Halobeggiatoa sp. HSG11]|nr:ABC transporter substrate-binding protein [Candidatus Halobeggiatoa sp. HSG11]